MVFSILLLDTTPILVFLKFLSTAVVDMFYVFDWIKLQFVLFLIEFLDERYLFSMHGCFEDSPMEKESERTLIS